MAKKRVVVTGMNVITALGDTLPEFYANLLAGKSGVKNWHSLDTSRVDSKVGGDLAEPLPQYQDDPLASKFTYNFKAAIDRLRPHLPPSRAKNFEKIFKKAPYSPRMGMLCALNAWRDAGLSFDLEKPTIDPFEAAVILGGHNFNQKYVIENYDKFREEPEYIEPLFAMTGLDSYIVAAISDVLGVRGPTYTIGGACASTNLALRDGMREIQHDGAKVAVIAGAIFEVGPLDIQAMSKIDAITYKSFNDDPTHASRPYDTRREGFIPSHGAGTLIIEDLEHALARKARIYCEVLGVQANSDANHLPQPSTEGQARLMADCLKQCGLKPSDIDYINAHATSTPLGDLTEFKAIKSVFGAHAKNVKINATKSMLGHCCWSAPVVENIAAIMQMLGNTLHPSINIDEQDPEVDLDVCANKSVPWKVNTFLKNSFGFSGINCCAIFRRYPYPA